MGRYVSERTGKGIRMRDQVTITNVNKFGKVTNGWYVRIGKRWRIFSEQDWAKGGLEWINSQLGAK